MHKIVRILYNIQTWGLAKEENEEVGKWIRCGGAALCGFWQPPCWASQHPPHLPRGFSPPQSGGLPSPNNPISEPGHAPPITKTRLGKLTNHKARCIRVEGDQVRLFKSRLDHLEGFHTNDEVTLSNKKNQYQYRGSKQSHMPHCTEIKIKTRTNYKHKQKYKRRVNHGKYSLSLASLCPMPLTLPLLLLSHCTSTILLTFHCHPIILVSVVCSSDTLGRAITPHNYTALKHRQLDPPEAFSSAFVNYALPTHIRQPPLSALSCSRLIICNT